MTLLQNPQSVKDAVSVANNACWAIGELAIKVSAYFYTICFLAHVLNSSRYIKHLLFVLLLALVSPCYMSLIKLQCTGPPQNLFLVCF